MNRYPIEIKILGSSDTELLVDLFSEIRKSGDDHFFHPHPFTVEEAEKKTEYSGDDLYYIVLRQDRILAYGMLRGWDEGYDIPSLGIAVHPLEKKKGLGELFMRFLHEAARRKGAKKVRLKVYADNQPAVALYTKLGYRFLEEKAGQMVGFLEL